MTINLPVAQPSPSGLGGISKSSKLTLSKNGFQVEVTRPGKFEHRGRSPLTPIQSVSQLSSGCLDDIENGEPLGYPSSDVQGFH